MSPTKLPRGAYFPPDWERFQCYTVDVNLPGDSGEPKNQLGWRKQYVDGAGMAAIDLWFVIHPKYLVPKVNDWGEESL